MQCGPFCRSDEVVPGYFIYRPLPLVSPGVSFSLFLSFRSTFRSSFCLFGRLCFLQQRFFQAGPTLPNPA
ncbi:hypothetical protein RSOLAG1IB_06995 [Rhizoctonia solani AG-1 IB]|uniref:Uncharacterized protein n=1 Tax=Thanatephorus cucumeris (strain AG1-IB / isolate 7/3/14) TaxID=1108050 RepID=A0A0B7F9W9_THACB|nr:hypothetical protein RSOLAG1IB_06995 [Rhizoctonia solani AG-1 IB]